MIESIERRGMLIGECSLPGETRADGVTPAHPNGWQLSRDRFLLLNATLGYRGVDDSLSTTWQLRSGGYDGPVIREGFFSRTRDDWDPEGRGVTWKKETGAMHVFGVPKGALVGGRRVAHENVFVCKFRVCARVYVAAGGWAPGGDYIEWWSNADPVIWRTHRVHWVQFRLTDDEGDIEILQPEREMRQVGFETGDAVCEHPVVTLNQTFARAWPTNPDGSEWVDIQHASTGDPAVSLLFTSGYRFNAATGLYEWTRCGPHVGDGLYEASVLPYRGDWLIAGRRKGHEKPRKVGVAWARLDDPFGPVGEWAVPGDVRTCNTPITAYACPDGIVRLFSGDGSLSPHASPEDPTRWIDNRNPLYVWDIDPDDGFRATATHLVSDIVADGVPIAREHGPVNDMAKLLPHVGGRTQTLVNRVRSCALDRWEPGVEERFGQTVHRLTAGDFASTGIYHARVHYTEDLPPEWVFE